MATNVIYQGTREEQRAVPVPTKTPPGKALIVGGRPAVTITGSGDYDGNKITLTANGETTVLAGGRGGVGLKDLEATVAFTGTYAFPVTGASAATSPQTTVYITSGGVLTLSASGNTKFGVVEFFRGEKSETDTAVTIGVNLG